MLKFLIIIMGFVPIAAMAGNFPLLGSSRSSCDSLWIERNQILNIAGQCFASNLGQAVFDNRDCTPGTPALTDTELDRISLIKLAEEGRLCDINTQATRIAVNARYGTLLFGKGGLTLGQWPWALQNLDVFPEDTGRERSCVVSGLSPEGDNFLALRSGPDVRYPQIGQLLSGERVYSTSACMGRWCFADFVISHNKTDLRNGWFHVRWCRP